MTTRFRIQFTGPREDQWKRDLKTVQSALHITDLHQTLLTAMRIAALHTRKMMLSTGEPTCIYRADDGTWTLQIGNLMGNVVEGLPTAQAALDLIINAQ